MFGGINSILKIATLNLCLGLQHKKDLVKNLLISNDLDILSMQETEVNENFDLNLLGIPGYILEIESNDTKSRVGYYIKDNIKYNRRHDLEGRNNHLVIVDIKNMKTNEKRIIIYLTS